LDITHSQIIITLKFFFQNLQIKIIFHHLIGHISFHSKCKLYKKNRFSLFKNKIVHSVKNKEMSRNRTVASFKENNMKIVFISHILFSQVKIYYFILNLTYLSFVKSSFDFNTGLLGGKPGCNKQINADSNK